MTTRRPFSILRERPPAKYPSCSRHCHFLFVVTYSLGLNLLHSQLNTEMLTVCYSQPTSRQVACSSVLRSGWNSCKRFKISPYSDDVSSSSSSTYSGDGRLFSPTFRVKSWPNFIICQIQLRQTLFIRIHRTSIPLTDSLLSLFPHFLPGSLSPVIAYLRFSLSRSWILNKIYNLHLFSSHFRRTQITEPWVGHPMSCAPHVVHTCRYINTTAWYIHRDPGQVHNRWKLARKKER